jgi:hypothetical protein
MHFQVNNNLLEWNQELINCFNVFTMIVKEFSNQLDIIDRIIHLYNSFLAMEKTNFDSLKLRMLNSIFGQIQKIKSKYINEVNKQNFQYMFAYQRKYYDKMFYRVFNYKDDPNDFWTLSKTPKFIERVYNQILYDGLSDDDSNKFYTFILKSRCKNTSYIDLIEICFGNYVNMKNLHNLFKSEKIF